MKYRNKCAGVAAVEFAIFLPMLVFLLLAIFDIARALQAQLIIVNMAREAAHITSRASLQYPDPQQIISTVASTSPPLDMHARGMIYITKVMGNSENCDRNGNNCTVRNIVIAQYRWAEGANQSHYQPTSSVWMCSNWASDGHCANLPSPGTSSPTAAVMTGQLANGDVIFAVDVFYNFNVIFGGKNLGMGMTTPEIGPDLHTLTVL